MLQPEEISDLSEHLRREGFSPSLYQVLAAQEVIHQQSRQDSDLGSLVRLTTLLRPIFSSTPNQQERFEDLYLTWLRARSRRPRTTQASASNITLPETPQTHWRMKLAVPCLLIVPALTAWFLWQDLRPREAVGRVVVDSQPVAQATVKLGDQTATTDGQGTFTIPFRNDDMPLSLFVEMNGYVPSQSQVGQTIEENRKWFYLASIVWDVQYQLGEVPLAKETAPTTPPPPLDSVQGLALSKLSLEKFRTIPPPTPSWWERLSYPTALAVLSPGLLVVAWLLYRFNRRAVLKRQSSRIPPELKQVQVQASTLQIFPSLSLRHVTQRLRQPRFEATTELDLPRTIDNTIQRGGLFTPVFGSKREPGYVALIDRATVADHQANVAAQVVKDLAKGYVLVRQYEFDEQPTILRVVDPLRAEPKHSTVVTAVATMVEVRSLGEVTAKLPTSRLLYFADPITHFDPLSGKLRPWVDSLEAWEERFLFTTRADGHWGQAERILSRRGYQVIPLSHLGLRLFSQLVEQGRPSTGAAQRGPRERWGSYEERPQRWLERHPPAQDTVARLLDDLRTTLGPDGIRWLAACAAYPEIHWALTLEWGIRLFGYGPTAEVLLPKLTPLVWFRHAFMPDWFRTALYDQLTPLTPQEAERISQELGEIISALNPESGDTLQLHIAIPSGAKQRAGIPVGGGKAWFQKLRRRLAIFEMGQAAEPGSPMHDYVMLQYLSGKRGKTLTPYAPKALLTLLFPKGQPWLGFRPLFLLMAAGLVTAGLWWSENPAPLPLPSPIAEVGFLPETNEVMLKRENGRMERWGQRDQELVQLESGEVGVFSNRLDTVKMGQLTVPDPNNQLDLVYQKEGQLRVFNRVGKMELVREQAPAAQVAGLHWPEGPDAFLVVAHAAVPELVKLSGLNALSEDEWKRALDAISDLPSSMQNAELPAELTAKKQAPEMKRQVASGKKQPHTRGTALTGKPKTPLGSKQSRVDEMDVSQVAQQQSEPNALEQTQRQQQDTKPSEVTASDSSTLSPQTPEPTQQRAEGQAAGAPAAPSSEQLPSIITGKDGAPMVLVAGGSFLMGSTKGEVNRAIKDCVGEIEKDQQTCKDWYESELPQHKVQINAFHLDKYEVTNRLFQQFVQQTDHRTTAEDEGSARVYVEGKGWEDVRGANWRKPEAGETVFDSNRVEHPVVTVSWVDARAYCRWAGKRLPTEAEFEYALRAGTTTKYWWGDGNPGSRRVENIADESAKHLLSVVMSGYDDGAVRTASIGSYEANPWGLHDMGGNVAEWTADWYDETYYGKSPERNPKGPSRGEFRVIRGGSWYLAPVHVRSASRSGNIPTARVVLIGFRCAQDIPK